MRKDLTQHAPSDHGTAQSRCNEQRVSVRRNDHTHHTAKSLAAERHRNAVDRIGFERAADHLSVFLRKARQLLMDARDNIALRLAERFKVRDTVECQQVDVSGGFERRMTGLAAVFDVGVEHYDTAVEQYSA